MRLVVLMLFGCTPDASPPPVPVTDADRDGVDDIDDCAPQDPAVYPGAPDAWYDGVDSDCEGNSDFDQDNDRFDRGEDCDDLDPDIHPFADELCNDVDEDCDGEMDEDPVDGIEVHWDNDGDGFGAVDSPTLRVCTYGGPYAASDDDCDDTNPDAFPDNPEVCDRADNDCDGEPDDNISPWFPDYDGDGHGSPYAYPVYQCFSAPPGYVAINDDCDEGNASVFPGAPPVPCDGMDNDCDFSTTEPPLVRLDGVPVADLATAIANATDGADIEVCDGTYAVEELVIDKPLTLRGVGFWGAVALDGQGLGPVVSVRTTAPVVIQDLEIRNGAGPQGGGLYVADGADVDARGLWIHDNRADEGGGVWLGEDALLTLEFSSVELNEAQDASGGARVGARSTLELLYSGIYGNTAPSCGGGALAEDATLTSGSSFGSVDGNTAATGHGGGLCVRSGVALDRIWMFGNVAATDGGALWADGPVTLDEAFLLFNTASERGGAIRLEDGAEASSIAGSWLGFNVAAAGGALSTSSPVTLAECQVTDNSETDGAAAAGGADVRAGTLTSVNTTWSANLDVDIVVGGAPFDTLGALDFVCDAARQSCQ